MFYVAAQMNVTNFRDTTPLLYEKNYKRSLIFARFDFVCYNAAVVNMGDELNRGALFSTVFANRAGCKKPIG